MKKALLLFAFILSSIVASAQMLVQQGVCYRYNGKNPRTPLSDVAIQYGSDSKTTISDNDGAFEMVFESKKTGDRIGRVKVTKHGMMVLNKNTVTEWTISDTPLCLILCDADDFNLQKQNLIAIGKSEAKNKYERQKAELDKQLETNQIDSSKYNYKLSEARKKLSIFYQQLDEYADYFARIDESEIDSTAQQAVDLFKQGKVNEAMHLFEQGNYLPKMITACQTITHFDQSAEHDEQGLSLAKQNRSIMDRNLKAQIAAYKVLNEWEKACSLMKNMADALHYYGCTSEYAFFCQTLGLYDEADTYYQCALDILNFDTDDYSYTDDPTLAPLLYDIAHMYSDMQRPVQSEYYYSESLEIQRRLVEGNPQIYEPFLVMTLNNLANQNFRMQRFDDSERYALEALEIERRIVDDDPIAIEPYMATTLYNLAILYSKVQRFAESVPYYLESLEIQRRLAKEDPQTYELDLIGTLYLAGISYAELEQYTLAIPCLEEAMLLCRKQMSDNPYYKRNYEGSFFALARLYSLTGNHYKCYEANEECLSFIRASWQEHPEQYKEDLINVLGNQSYQCIFIGQLTQSEQYACEALSIDPSQHWINTNLASSLLLQGKYCKAKKIYKQYKEELKESFLQDLNDFEKNGIIPKARIASVKRIKRFLSK